MKRLLLIALTLLSCQATKADVSLWQALKGKINAKFDALKQEERERELQREIKRQHERDVERLSEQISKKYKNRQDFLEDIFGIKDIEASSTKSTPKQTTPTQRYSVQNSSVNFKNGRFYIVCKGHGYISKGANFTKEEFMNSCRDIKLVLRWKDGEYGLYIDYMSPIFSQGEFKHCECGGVDSAGNEKNRHKDSWKESTDNEAVFYCGDVVTLINELQEYRDFDAFIVLQNDTAVMASFSGFSGRVKAFVKEVETYKKSR